MTHERTSSSGDSEVLVYRLDEVAGLLKVSQRTIYNLVRHGDLVGRRIGSRVVVPRTSVEAFLRKDHATGEEGKRRRRGSATRTRRGSR